MNLNFGHPIFGFKRYSGGQSNNLALECTILGNKFILLYPASEASREVANLTERKNLKTPVYGVKEFVCLSVCLSACLSVINFDPNYLRTGKTEWAEIFLGHLWQN